MRWNDSISISMITMGVTFFICTCILYSSNLPFTQTMSKNGKLKPDGTKIIIYSMLFSVVLASLALVISVHYKNQRFQIPRFAYRGKPVN
jgi:hypothetical protein